MRQDVGADVSPGHHDPAGIGEGPLTRHEGRAHGGDGRELAHPLVDLGDWTASVTSSPSSRTRR